MTRVYTVRLANIEIFSSLKYLVTAVYFSLLRTKRNYNLVNNCSVLSYFCVLRCAINRYLVVTVYRHKTDLQLAPNVTLTPQFTDLQDATQALTPDSRVTW